MKTPKDGRKEILDQNQIRWLIDCNTLESMSHLSLRQRAVIVKDKYQLRTFSHYTLSRYYKRYGIKYNKPDYKYWRSQAENNDLRGQQAEYVRMMVGHMEKRTFDEIIYIDETTCNLWQKTSRCWLRPGMKLRMLKFRGHSITIIGAISQERGLVYYEIFPESNNSERFGNFLLALKEKCRGRKAAIVQDNLRIHHARALSETYDENFRRIMLPIYSSELNPIERLCSLVKRKWTQSLFHITEELTKERKNKSIQ